MSLAQFTKGFASTLDTGIDFAREMDRQGDVSTSQKAGDLLAQIQAYDPYKNVTDAGAQGVPEPGQKTLPSPTSGFDGEDFQKLQNQYMSAIAGMSNMRDYAAAKANFGQVKMDKINDTIDSALSAYDRGDMTGAAKMLRASSAYMSPGYTPEVNVDPKTGAFVVANYKDGKPVGGYAVTRDQLLDIRGRNTDYNAWATLDERKQEHKEEMGLARARFAQSTKDSNARLALAKSAAANAAELAAVKIGSARIEQATLALTLGENLATSAPRTTAAAATSFKEAVDANAAAKKTAATSESDIAATIATNRNIEATQTVAGTKALETSEGDIAQTNATNAATVSSKIEEKRKSDAAEGEEFAKKTAEALDNYTHYEEPPDPEAAGATVDKLGAAVKTDTKGGPKKILDPWWFEDPTSDGQSYLRAGMDAFGVNAARDIHKLNPGVSAEGTAALIEGSIGRSQSTDVELPKEEGGPIYLRNGVDKVRVSPEIAGVILDFRDAHAQALLSMKPSSQASPPGEPPVPGTPQPPQPAPPQPNVQPAIPEGTGGPAAPPVQSSLSPFGPAAAIAQQGGPLAPGRGAVGIPEGPPSLSGPSGARDDTAAIAPGARSGLTNAGQALPAAARADFGNALAAWKSAGAPPRGPQAVAVSQAIQALPPGDQRQALQIVQQLQGK